MYEIDIRNINTKKEFHDILRSALPLPDYYGNNLDALYDVLTETSENMEIKFIWDEQRTDAPEEVEKLIKGLTRMCNDIREECPNIQIEWTSSPSINRSQDEVITNDELSESGGPKMKFKMVHENYNVKDIDESLAFYEKALGLKEKRRSVADDGSYIIVFIGNEESTFELELTWLADHPFKYDIGEEEFHLAFRTDDFDAAYKLHEEMGCICFENHEMGIYFIQDPDGYWLEILPTRH